MRFIAALMVGLLGAAPVAAHEEQLLERMAFCASIQEAVVRLTCFDTAFRDLVQNPSGLGPDGATDEGTDSLR